MRRLSFVILGFLFSLGVFAQHSPHGKQLKIDCIECHTTGSWTVNLLTSTFDHASTAFQLQGQHNQIDCKLCHASLNFSDEKGKNACALCHVDVHQQTLGNDCEACHTSQSWIINDVREIHLNSRFPLLGAHANADCFDCHLSENLLQFKPIGVECVDCHRADYMATTSPNHQQAGYSTDCFDCHNMYSVLWNSGDFDHHFFPLTQGHAIDDCYACHGSGAFASISPDCETCHIDNYNAANNPPHATLSFSVNCLDCHTTIPGWTPATFDIHNDFYVLEGAHAAIANDCLECHSSGYTNTPNTCYACHTEAYNSTSNPSHSELNFSTDCAECHSQSAWEPSNFDHNSIYVLEGAHAAIANDCLECHSSGYTNTPNTCYACHTEAYNSTSNPSHSESNFSTDCTDCHSQSAWIPATFDHNTIYVLEGAHAAIANDCVECHADGYTNTPNTCYACHRTEYENTTDPSHQASNFPTECTECHSQNAWEPSTFDHDGLYFPIYSGEHNGEWNSCADCHTVASNYAIFSCIDCHEHNQTDMDDEHSDVSDYQYNSVSCLNCHPNGKED